MKKYISIIFLLISTVGVAGQSAPDAVELTRLLNEFLAGAGRNDAAVHDRFWADDLIYTRGVGVRTNKEELMKGVRSAPVPKAGDAVTVYTAEDVRIQQYGEAAVVAFKLVGSTTRPDGTRSVSNHLNTGTFINRNGKWQAVAWQATPVSPPAVKPIAQTASAVPTPTGAPTGPVGASALKMSGTSQERTYTRGPRGGCYYTNPSGKKIYVDHSNCK